RNSTSTSLQTTTITIAENIRGKETMDLLITKTGMEVDKNPEAGQQADEEHIFEEVSFDRCFYIYGGLEQLEELEALSSHYTLLFNRRKAKLSPEQKSFYEGKLKQVQQIFSLSTEGDENGADSDKGKQVETVEGSGDEMKILCDASVSKDADMAVGCILLNLCRFATSLAGIAINEIIHMANNFCLFLFTNYIFCFLPGISDVVEAYQSVIKVATANVHDGLPKTSVQEKADAISDHLYADQAIALDKIQKGLQFLAFVVISSSMPSA
ncbi:hypothetical protein MKX03_023506, partial [Papaver bracteatum]